MARWPKMLCGDSDAQPRALLYVWLELRLKALRQEEVEASEAIPEGEEVFRRFQERNRSQELSAETLFKVLVSEAEDKCASSSRRFLRAMEERKTAEALLECVRAGNNRGTLSQLRVCRQQLAGELENISRTPGWDKLVQTYGAGGAERYLRAELKFLDALIEAFTIVARPQR